MAVQAKSMILYVGYQVDDPALVSKLTNHLGAYINKLREEVYTVHLHHKDAQQPFLSSWYNKKQNTVITGYLKKIYTKSTKNVDTVVGEINIEGGQYYITLVNDSNIKLQDIKLLVNRGEFGQPVTLASQIPITFKACMGNGEVKKPKEKPLGYYCDCLTQQ
jgi:hypothetical protein